MHYLIANHVRPSLLLRLRGHYITSQALRNNKTCARIPIAEAETNLCECYITSHALSTHFQLTSNLHGIDILSSDLSLSNDQRPQWVVF